MWDWNYLHTRLHSLPSSVLIEPLWDWNLSPRIGKEFTAHSFNRTIVGLKSGYKSWHIAILPVLIEPLWDWNIRFCLSARQKKLVLIEPLWDWNLGTAIRQWGLPKSFNRTIVGLKFGYSPPACREILGFNRTIVGLK